MIRIDVLLPYASVNCQVPRVRFYLLNSEESPRITLMGASIGKLLVSVNHTSQQTQMSSLTGKEPYPGQAKPGKRGKRMLPCWTPNPDAGIIGRRSHV